MGRFKTPTGSVVNVDDDLAARIGATWKPLDGSEEVPEGTPTESWKVPELRAYAAEHDIDLGDAKKKDEILAAIAGAGNQSASSPE